MSRMYKLKYVLMLLIILSSISACSKHEDKKIESSSIGFGDWHGTKERGKGGKGFLIW